jgi:serine/threonine-protein kinase
MAPEQWRTGVVADPRIDVYALGLIVFEMLSGTPPFLGDSWVDLLHLHISGTPPRLQERGVEVPAALEAVVRRALAKEPDERWPLDGSLRRGAVRFRRPAERRRARRRVRAVTERVASCRLPSPQGRGVAGRRGGW